MRLTEQEKSVLEEIFLHHEQFIFQTAYRILGNVEDAEDITIDAALKLLPFFLRDKVHSKGFIYVVTKNIALNHVQRRKTERRLITEQITTGESYSSSVDHYNSEFTQLREFMLSISEPMTEILTLKYVYGLSYKEIASVLDISISNVKIRIFKAKRKMKQCENIQAFYGGDDNE